MMESLRNRWVVVRSIIERGGPFQRSEFEPNIELIEMIRSPMVRILVIGAGGLGCELLKDLALMGFRNLDVIDMDTVDLSNLNRQFLFRSEDIGSPKAEVAARFIMNRIDDMQVNAHFKKIQDFDEDFYRQFGVVVCGLDSIVARRWINGMLTSLVTYTDDGNIELESIIPMVEGGTEGFKGNARVILPGVTPCVECTLDLYPPQINFPLCTLAHTPRLPEHCIEYVRLMVWPQKKPFGESTSIDGDNPHHLEWIHQRSIDRAMEYGIEGVTMRLTQGVVKRIIPAVASTNAVIAAACATEVFKLITFCHDYLNNYMNFNDTDGVYTFSFEAERKEGCIACSQVPKKLQFQSDTKLHEVIEFLQESGDYQMKSPSITTQIDGKNRTLYMNIQSMKEKLKPNLDKTLKELGLMSGSSLFVADVTTPQTVQFRLALDDMTE